jgi:hypothetical protein
MGLLDGLQFGLDVIGLVPGFGEMADGINGLISLGRGDYVGAGLSFGAMVPVAGWGATTGKFGRRAANAAGAMGGAGKAGVPASLVGDDEAAAVRKRQEVFAPGQDVEVVPRRVLLFRTEPLELEAAAGAAVALHLGDGARGPALGAGELDAFGHRRRLARLSWWPRPG